MQTKSARYRLGAGDDELLVFVYASAAARRLVTDGLDSLSVAPKGTRGRYRVAPLLVTSNNLAAIVLSANGRQLERVSLALSAGLPPHQP